MNKLKPFGIIRLGMLLALILLPRLPALGTFVTVDESTWLMRSANFFYALGQREFEQTVYAYHPAVTTMWTGAAAMAIDFPAYRGLGQGYFEKEWQFSDFLSTHGYDPIEMLKTSRLITVGINTGLLIAIYYLLMGSTGWLTAFITTLFLSFDPFLLGHTRILAHEGMMSLLLLVSILAFLNFLDHRIPARFLLIISGITAGLAVLTKSSATIILPFIGLICIIEGISKIRASTQNWSVVIWEQFKHLGKAWGIWLLVAIFSFVLFWPGMWVNPSKMLYEVYGNAFSYAIQGYNLEYADSVESSEINANDGSRFMGYASEIPWRTTPAVWLGIILGISALLSRKFARANQILVTFLLFALLFTIMMSLAKGRLEARYIMVAYTSLSLIAGLGIGLILPQIRTPLVEKNGWIVPGMILTVLMVMQVAASQAYFPYYFNYSNPLLERVRKGIQTPVIGYGEGLELAADYLAKKPSSEDLTVMSWYGIGPFSFYYPGKTENLYPSKAWTMGLVERLERSDYLVIYQYHQQKRNMPAKLLRDIASVVPEYTIWLHGVEYIRVYPTHDLPSAVYTADQLETP